LSSRVIPDTPASLLRLAARVSSSISGSDRSTPASDHVPIEITNEFGAIGVAAKADAVSCPATRTTPSPGGAPTRSAMPGSSASMRLPGPINSGNHARSSSSAAITSSAQARATGSKSCVVEAIVRSAATCPVSR
jgi:hypothetical protein